MDQHRIPRNILDIHTARRRHLCAWTASVSKCGSVFQHAVSSIRYAAPSSGSGLSNAETAPACVPTVGPAVPAGKRAARGASVTGLSWSAPSCCGCIGGVWRAPSAGLAPGTRVQPSQSGRSGRRASPSRDARNACGGVRVTTGPVALVSPHAPGCAGPLRGAVVAVRARSAAPWGSRRRPGGRGTAPIRCWSTWTADTPWRPAKGARLRLASPGAPAARPPPATG
jgi:hypothetical protein